MSQNKDMGDKHEAFLVETFGGRQTKGSGNQWQNPADGRTSRKHLEFAFAWDGKSTLARSISVTHAMWDKIRLQAGGNRPMLALRFYQAERLKPIYDLVVISAHDAAEMVEKANKMALIEEVGCLDGSHEHEGIESDSVPGMMVKRGACIACGKWPYEATEVNCCCGSGGIDHNGLDRDGL